MRPDETRRFPRLHSDPTGPHRGGRINYPLLASIAAAVVVVGGGLVAFYFVFVRTSVQDLIDQGDQMVAEGDFTRATGFYGRAIKREPRNAELILKYVDAVEERPAENILDARFLLGQIIEFTRRASEAQPENTDLLKNFYDLLYTLGQDLDPSFYDQLLKLTSAELNRNPDNALARRYRGLAQVKRLTIEDPIEVHERTREDLEASLAAQPDDYEVKQSLVLWRLVEAGRVADAGFDQQRVTELINDAIDESQLLVDEDPDDIDRVCSHLDLLLMPAVLRVQAARPLVESVENRLLEDPMPKRAVLLLLDIIPRIYTAQRPNPYSNRPTTDGIIRAERLASRAVEAYPDNLEYRLAYGRLLRLQNKLEEAYDQYQSVVEKAYTGYAIQTVLDYQRRMEAYYHMGDIRLAQAQRVREDDPDQAAAYEEEVQEIIDGIADVEGEELALVKKLQGKLKLQQGEFGKAMILLDDALLATNNADVELLILSAQARLRMGAPNAAAEQLAEAVARRPGLMQLRTELAKIYLASRQERRAREQIEVVLAADPDNVEALKLQAGAMASDGRIDEAIAQYRRLDPVSQHPELLRPIVQLMIRAGRKDEARELVERRFGYDPTDLTALRMMVSLYPDPQQREAFFERALSEGADPAVVGRLRQLALTGEAPPVVEASSSADPYETAMRSAGQALRERRLDDAREFAEQALEVRRDDLSAMSLLFGICIEQQRWSRAEELVNRVTVRNLDLANGAFWQGRLAQARGDFTRAVNFFRRGLEARPIYPLGHRQLGDLLLRTEDYEGAIRAYETSISQDSRNLPAMRGMAAAYNQLGRYDEALEKIREMLRQDSTNVGLMKLYIDYEQRYGDPERALRQRTALKEFNARDFDNRRGLAQTLATLGRFEEAVREMEQIREEEGFTRVNAAFLARLYRENRDDEQSLAIIDEYIASRGDAADEYDYAIKGRNLLEMGRFEEAIAAYREAIDREDERFMMASREFGDQMFERQVYNLAIETYESINQEHPQDVGVELRLCEALIRAGDYDEAERRLQRIGMSNPKVPPLLASIAQRQGDIDKALTLLDQAIQISKNDPALYGLRGRMLLVNPTRENLAAAIRDLNREVALRPTATETWVLLSQVYLSAGDSEEAIPTLRQLLELEPENVQGRLALVRLFLLREEVPQARGVLEEAMELFPENAEWPRQLANLEADQGNRLRATQLWERAVDLETNSQNIAGLVISYINAGMTEKAIDAFLAHVEIVNQEPFLQALRARVLDAAGAEQEALNVARLAMERSTRFPQLQAVSVQVSEGMGPRETIELLEEVSEKDLHPRVWVELIQAGLYLDAREFQQCLSLLEDMRSRIPEGDIVSLTRWHEVFGNVNYRLENFPEAASSFEFIVERNPEDARTLNNLAFVLTKHLDRAEEALPLAQTAARLLPESAATLDTLGVVQWANGRTAQARQTLERAIRIKPIAASQLHLAQLLIEMNNPDDYEEIRQLLDSAKRSAEREKDEALLRELAEAEEAYRQLGS